MPGGTNRYDEHEPANHALVISDERLQGSDQWYRLLGVPNLIILARDLHCAVELAVAAERAQRPPSRHPVLQRAPAEPWRSALRLRTFLQRNAGANDENSNSYNS